MATTEITPVCELVTSITHLSIDGHEAFLGPIITGYYTNGDGEIWLEQEGCRIHIPAEHFKAIMKQLKRAHGIAQEPSHG